MMPRLVIVASATLRAMPKSVSLIRPSSEISTLPGFTSRCTMPARCADSSAAATASATAAPCSRVSGPRCRIRSARLEDGTSSMTT